MDLLAVGPKQEKVARYKNIFFTEIPIWCLNSKFFFFFLLSFVSNFRLEIFTGSE